MNYNQRFAMRVLIERQANRKFTNVTTLIDETGVQHKDVVGLIGSGYIERAAHFLPRSKARVRRGYELRATKAGRERLKTYDVYAQEQA